MGEDQREGEQAVSEQDRGPEDIRQEIEETREELGDTVNALSQKADVKSRAREKVSGVKESIAGKKDEALDKAQEATPESFDVGQTGDAARQAVGTAKQNPAALAGGAFVVGLVIGRALGRRSS
jgi:hypothetical protein